MKPVKDILESYTAFKPKLEELQASFGETNAGVLRRGPGGSKYSESIGQVLAALLQLEVVTARQTGRLAPVSNPWFPYQVLSQLLRVGWEACSAAATAICTLESATLSTGTWISPFPSDVAAWRVCVAGHKLFESLASDCIRLMRAGMRQSWDACPGASQSMSRLVTEGFPERLASLTERLGWTQQAGLAMALAASESGTVAHAGREVLDVGGLGWGGPAGGPRLLTDTANAAAAGPGHASKEAKKPGLKARSLSGGSKEASDEHTTHSSGSGHGFGTFLSSLGQGTTLGQGHTE